MLCNNSTPTKNSWPSLDRQKSETPRPVMNLDRSSACMVLSPGGVVTAAIRSTIWMHAYTAAAVYHQNSAFRAPSTDNDCQG
jgi:hypothetical protein